MGLNRSERRRIQRTLASLGFEPGPADGLFGSRTRLAIQSYQKEKGFPETGYLDAEPAKALLAATAEAQAENAGPSSEAVRAERLAAEREFWTTVKGSEEPGDFEACLERFPGGVYEALARRRRDELMVLADDAAYSRAKSLGTVDLYLEYMRTYPSGRHLDEIRRLRADTDQMEQLGRRWPAGKRFRDCDGCPELVVVPAGEFMMGSPAHERDRYGDEGPVRRVTFERRFAVGVYEVTRGEFERFVKEAGHSADSCWKYDMRSKKWKGRRTQNWRKPGFRQTRRDPVVCINHIDAQAYVRWLARKTGQSYRLLSESEWEFAARAGTTAPYHTGTTISAEQANRQGLA